MSIPGDEGGPQHRAGDDVPPVPPSEPAAGVPPLEPAPPAPSAPGAYNAPPSYPGAYPAASPAAAVPAAPAVAPNTVNIAFWLYIASAALSVISGIVGIITVSAGRQAAINAIQRQGANLHGMSVDAVANIAITVAVTVAIVTLVFWAIAFVLFAYFMRRGANWARIVLTVLTGLSLLNIIAAFGLGALQVAASIVAVVLMWLRPSTEYFNAVRAAKAPRA